MLSASASKTTLTAASETGAALNSAADLPTEAASRSFVKGSALMFCRSATRDAEPSRTDMSYFLRVYGCTGSW